MHGNVKNSLKQIYQYYKTNYTLDTHITVKTRHVLCGVGAVLSSTMKKGPCVQEQLECMLHLCQDLFLLHSPALVKSNRVSLQNLAV